MIAQASAILRAVTRAGVKPLLKAIATTIKPDPQAMVTSSNNKLYFPDE